MSSLLPYAPELDLSVCPQERTVSVRQGQFWLIRGTSAYIGGLHEVASSPPEGDHTITLRRWMTHSTLPCHIYLSSARPGLRVKPTACTTRITWKDMASRATHRVIIQRTCRGSAGRVMATLPFSMAAPTPLSTRIAAARRA